MPAGPMRWAAITPCVSFRYPGTSVWMRFLGGGVGAVVDGFESACGADNFTQPVCKTGCHGSGLCCQQFRERMNVGKQDRLKFMHLHVGHKPFFAKAVSHALGHACCQGVFHVWSAFFVWPRRGFRPSGPIRWHRVVVEHGRAVTIRAFAGRRSICSAWSQRRVLGQIWACVRT